MAKSPEQSKLENITVDHPNNGDVASKALDKFQQDSKVLPGDKSSSSGNGKLEDYMDPPFKDRIISTLPDASSAESIRNAETAVDARVSGLLPERDQKLLKALNHGVVDGDSKAFGDAVASFKGDPAKLKDYISELQKNLDATHAGVNAAVTKDGNVVVYKDGASTAVQYDGKTGKATVVPIENENGNAILGQGEVLNKTPDGVMGDIGRSARSGVLGLNWLEVPPLFPEKPRELPDFPNHHFPEFPRELPPDFPEVFPKHHQPDWKVRPDILQQFLDRLKNDRQPAMEKPANPANNDAPKP